MLFINTLLTLLLNINSTPLGPDMVYQNNYKFTFETPLPSFCGSDDRGDGLPVYFNNSLSVEGFLSFQGGQSSFYLLRTEKFTFVSEYQKCSYDGMANQYNYEVVDSWSKSVSYTATYTIENDNSEGGSLDDLRIDYYLENGSDLNHCLRFWNGNNLEYSDDSSINQGYIINYISSGLNIRFDTDYISKQVSNFINSQFNGDFDYGRGYQDGQEYGYGQGYNDGYDAGFSADTTAMTIFNGILNIGLVPINFFLGIFNYEILGINVAQFVSALLSVAMIIIVVRMITGKKNE